VHHLLAVDDLLSRRAPFGSSKRERRAPGPLTELARSSLAAPSPADAPAYFTALAAALRPLLSLAEGQGHCSGAAAARLRTALDQLPDLAADA